MKKVLLGTSAIALASAFTATSANAADWDVKVGGYMEQFLGAAFSDGSNRSAAAGDVDVDGVDVKSDSEVHFLPSITLDNGIKIGANVQLEGNTSGDQIDESFLFIDGAFGTVQLGSENSAGYTMHYAAPDVTFVGVNSGSMTAFVPFSGGSYTSTAANAAEVNIGGSDNFRGTLGSTFLENNLNNDAMRITYFTPRFAGFQIGGSYARDAGQDDNEQKNCDGAVCDFFDVGANYVNSFGDFDIAVSGRWGIALRDGGKDPQVWGGGANFGYGGFTLGGSYAEQNNSVKTVGTPGGGGTAAEADITGVADGHAWDVGVSYETGPWGFSFTYFRGRNRDDEQLAVGTGSDERLIQYLGGVNYALAKGVDLGLFGGYVEFKEKLGTNDDGSSTFNGGDDTHGWVVGSGVRVRF